MTLSELMTAHRGGVKRRDALAAVIADYEAGESAAEVYINGRKANVCVPFSAVADAVKAEYAAVAALVDQYETALNAAQGAALGVLES